MRETPHTEPDPVQDWIFDLDNTLYPASCDLFSQVNRRIQDYIGDFLGLSPAESRALQHRYLREFGASMRGLVVNHDMDPRAFLAYVHDIDFSPVPHWPALDRALARLPGRKLVFTNASADYAGKVLARLGVTRHFAAVFDIIAADFMPKPQPAAYHSLIERHGVDPGRAVLFEDIARNLEPAAELGMTTVLVEPEPSAAGEAVHVHHATTDLVDWLEDRLAGITAARA